MRVSETVAGNASCFCVDDGTCGSRVIENRVQLFHFAPSKRIVYQKMVVQRRYRSCRREFLSPIISKHRSISITVHPQFRFPGTHRSVGRTQAKYRESVYTTKSARVGLENEKDPTLGDQNRLVPDCGRSEGNKMTRRKRAKRDTVVEGTKRRNRWRTGGRGGLGESEEE